MSKINPYKVLGISKNSSAEDAKRAYKKLIKKYHPDINPSEDAARNYKIVQKSYEFIKKRLQSNTETTEIKEAESISDESLKTKYIILNIPVSKVLTTDTIPYEIELDTYCDECGGSGESDTSDTENKRMCYECRGRGSISSSHGIMRVQKKCEHCDGEGYVIQNNCESCDGTGELKITRDLEINIPDKVKSGTEFTIDPVENDFGPSKFKQIHFSVQIVSEDGISIDDYGNIVIEKDIDTLQSILGGDVCIDIIETTINIPELIESGHIETIWEKGLEWWGNKKAELNVRFNIVQSKKISAPQIEALRKIINN